MQILLNPLNLADDEVAVFAYGSNMLAARIRSRAAAAKPVGAAILERFKLRWNKRSQDGSGKCTIEETGRPDDFVWGVLYGLGPDEKKRLDQAEGLGRGYGERSVTVLWDAKRLRVIVYYATSIDPAIKPYEWYRDLVVAGAREHDLPSQYVASLEATSTVTDPDAERVARAREYLG